MEENGRTIVDREMEEWKVMVAVIEMHLENNSSLNRCPAHEFRLRGSLGMSIIKGPTEPDFQRGARGQPRLNRTINNGNGVF